MIPCCALSATSLVAWVLTTMPSATGIVQDACGLGMRPAVAGVGDVDQALAAGADRLEQRVVAEPRDLDADLLGGADHQRALGHADLDAVDGQRDQVGLLDLGAAVIMRAPSAAKTVEATGSNGQPPCGGAGGTRRGSTGSSSMIGLVAPSPSAQNERPRMLSHWSSRTSRSSSRAHALLELGQHLHQPPGALAARRALAAGLVLVELGPAQHGPDHAGGLVEDLQRPGAEHRAGRADRLEVQRHVEVLGGQDRGRRTARRPELQLVAVADAAGQVDQRAQRDAQRRLVLPGLRDVAGQGEDRRSPWTSRCPSRRTSRRRCR